MPTYEYRCTSCGEHLEVVQSFRDDALTSCAACGGALRKVFGSIGVVFKGSGFYKTDSRPAAGKASKDTAPAASEGSSTTSKADGDSSGSKSAAPAGSSTGSAAPSGSGATPATSATSKAAS